MIKNQVTDVIAQRRSIRKYKAEPVTEEQLTTILECGFLAPSGSNCQNWHVTVVKSENFLSRLSKAFAQMMMKNENLPDRMKERFSDPNFSVGFGAPVVLFISADGPRDNACFLAENIVLTAHSIGLGTCYLGGIMAYLNTEEGKPFVEEMNLPEGCELLFGITVGVPDEAPEAKPRDFTKVNYI